MRRIGIRIWLLNKRLFKTYSFLLILCLVPLLVSNGYCNTDLPKVLILLAISGIKKVREWAEIYQKNHYNRQSRKTGCLFFRQG